MAKCLGEVGNMEPQAVDRSCDAAATRLVGSCGAFRFDAASAFAASGADGSSARGVHVMNVLMKDAAPRSAAGARPMVAATAAASPPRADHAASTARPSKSLPEILLP